MKLQRLLCAVALAVTLPLAAEAAVSISVNIAPLIPGLSDRDIVHILEAARAAGVFIPALCDPFPLPGLCRKTPAGTSCMVCVVRVNGAARLAPSCATRVADGMRIESETGKGTRIIAHLPLGTAAPNVTTRH